MASRTLRPAGGVILPEPSQREQTAILISTKSQNEKNHGLRFEGILKIEFASKQLPSVQKSANSIT
jgi:hypothetical protein